MGELVALRLSHPFGGVRLAGVRSSTRQSPIRDQYLRETSTRGSPSPFGLGAGQSCHSQVQLTHRKHYWCCLFPMLYTT